MLVLVEVGRRRSRVAILLVHDRESKSIIVPCGDTISNREIMNERDEERVSYK